MMSRQQREDDWRGQGWPLRSQEMGRDREERGERARKMKEGFGVFEARTELPRRVRQTDGVRKKTS